MVDISTELALIADNPRGAVVKGAIHSALEKLSLNGGGGTAIPVHAGSFVKGTGVRACAIDHSTFIFPDDCPFTCDLDVYIDKIIDPVIYGRTYHKLTAEYAIGVVVVLIDVYTGNPYTVPSFLSPVSNTAVHFQVEYPTGTINTITEAGTLEYAGLTWYYSQSAYAMGGSYTDSTGTLVKYPEPVDYTEQGLKAVLEWAHAGKNEEV